MISQSTFAPRAQGSLAEQLVQSYLEHFGLVLVAKNAAHTGRGAVELDLIMQDQETLVFIEVRQRRYAQFGGALASVTPTKQRHLIKAAHFFLESRYPYPPCRFDVVAWNGVIPSDPYQIPMHQWPVVWIKGAFEAWEP